MTARRARSLVVSLLCLSLVATAGCGHARKTETAAKTEGLYLTVGDLIYQVQISRLLNPRDPEDKAYLQGLAPADRTLSPDQAWFAVFMRVENNTKSTHMTSNEFRIVDTQENTFTPVSLPRSNPFSYQAVPLAGGTFLPQLESAAANGPVQQGAMILFKLSQASLANRPLELQVISPDAPPTKASVDLDV
jgi:hypothetical protein